MKFEILSEGFISRREPGTLTATAAGARCIVTKDGEIVCTFVVQEKLGYNDFKPILFRSKDGGKTWHEQGFIWPHLQNTYSIFGSVSRASNGDLFFYGTRTPIDQPGESLWSEETQGLKRNELVWAKSSDNGKKWTEPLVIPMPIPGSAEAPGAMLITRNGHWFCCYAPYNTFDPKVIVDRSQVVALRSNDQGKTWHPNSMMRFEDPESSAAEAWIVELTNGHLLGTAWHISNRKEIEYPNAYALSTDTGKTWKPTQSTGIMGQSTALTPLPDGRTLFIYNQRKHGEIGVYLIVAKPTESNFGILTNEIIWRAETKTQSNTSGEHSEWKDFSFGEPSITLLPDQTLLATLWCIQPSGSGIRYIKLQIIK